MDLLEKLKKNLIDEFKESAETSDVAYQLDEMRQTFTPELSKLNEELKVVSHIELILPEEKVKPINTREHKRLKEACKPFKEFLQRYGCHVISIDCQIGPTTANYRISLDLGVRFSKVSKLEKEIQAFFKSRSLRIQAPIPETNLIGVEVPRKNRDKVPLLDLLYSREFKEFRGYNSPLSFPAGISTSNKFVFMDLAKAPHALVAGCTGSGKTVFLHTMLTSIILSNSQKEVELFLIDPKGGCEFKRYKDVPHVKTEIVIDSCDANEMIKNLVSLMDERMSLFKKSNVVNISEYNKKFPNKIIKYCLLVVEEFSDLILSGSTEQRKTITNNLTRIAQKARSAGIHLVAATQKPTASSIPTEIKSNLPTRIACKTVNSVDSRVIIDRTGAEKLAGHGDMIVIQPSGDQEGERTQGCYLPDGFKFLITY